MAPSGGKRGGGRGGGGGGGRGQSREVQISKALSLVLRHAAEKEGVKIDSQGYANVGELLQWRRLKSLKVTLPDILDAVSNSDKKRFGLLYVPPESESSKHEEAATSSPPSTLHSKLEPSSETTSTPPIPDQAQDSPATQKNAETETETDPTALALSVASNDSDPTHYLIRARQGHSIKTVDTASLLQKLSLEEPSPVPLPDTVVHGTYHAAWPKILASGGLKCMSRNHVHFASGPALETVLPDGIHGRVAPVSAKGKGKGHGGVISGMRGDAQILIYIDIKKALRAGCPFWMSENGVILSEGMSTGEQGTGIVPLEFFDVVVERKNGLGVLWEGGELVKETPEWMLSAKAPAGKGERRGGNKGAPRLKVEKDTELVEDV